MNTRSRRRALIAVCSVVLVLAAAGAVNYIGVRMLGDTNAWLEWLAQHKPHFFLWRLLVYAALVYGWLRTRRAVIERATEGDAAARIRRVEVAATLSIVLLELSAFRFVAG